MIELTPGHQMTIVIALAGFALVIALVLLKAAYDGIHNMRRKKR